MKKIITKGTLLMTQMAVAAQLFASQVYAGGGTSGFSINVPRPTGTIQNINKLISGAITLIFLVAGLTAFIYLLLGGIKWITSGGDSGKVEEARGQIVQALIGLLVVLAAWGLIWLMQELTTACFGIGCDISLPVFS